MIKPCDIEDLYQKIDRLCEEGYIEAALNDKGEIVYSVTEKGRKLLDAKNNRQ